MDICTIMAAHAILLNMGIVKVLFKGSMDYCFSLVFSYLTIGNCYYMKLTAHSTRSWSTIGVCSV